MKDTDQEFLIKIYQQLQYVHSTREENPLMRRLRAIIRGTAKDQSNPSENETSKTLYELEKQINLYSERRDA